MAMSKRQMSAMEDTSAKKARVSMDPVQAEFAPVIELLQSSDLPKDCKTMLKAAVAPCLSTKKENRHAYQEKILQAFTDVFTNTEAGRLADVNQLEEQLAALTKDQGKAKTVADAAQDRAKEAKEKSDHLGKVVEDARNSVQKAKQTLGDEHKQHDSLTAIAGQRAAQKDGMDKVVNDLFKPLESSQVAGRQWQKRDKMSKQLVDHLQELGIEESLASALPIAMKDKTTTRGEFAQETIKFASDMLAQRIESLSKEKDDLDAQAVEQHDKIVAAQAEVQKAEEAFKACEEDHCTGQNEWLELHTLALTNAETLKSFEPRFAEVQCFLDAAKERLAVFTASMEKFEVLKNRSESDNLQVLGDVEPADTKATEEIVGGSLQRQGDCAEP